jgi:hypothetical protein
MTENNAEVKKTSQDLAEEDLNLTTQIIRDVAKVSGQTGAVLQSKINAAVARNILREETGFFGEETDFPFYGLDDETRDRLLAHCRQDTAHALTNTVTLMKVADVIKRSLKTIKVYLIILTLAVAILIAQLN